MNLFRDFRNSRSFNHVSVFSKSFLVQDVSFEIKEDYKTRGGFRFIERGRGYVRVLVIYKEEVRWLLQLCRKQHRFKQNFQQVGCLRGGDRSLICSIVPGGNGRKLELRLFAPYGRRQIRFPEMSTGSGWLFLTNVLREFLPDETAPTHFKNDTLMELSEAEIKTAELVPKGSRSYVQVAAIPYWQIPEVRSHVKGQQVFVNYEDAVENSMFMNRCLIGRLGASGEAKMDAVGISSWVNRKWRIPGGVKVRELDGERFLFIFPSKQLAEKTMESNHSIDGHRLWLDIWHSWSCCSRRGWNDNSVWIRVVGLPVFLWSSNVFRSIGNCCGGFLEEGVDYSNSSSYRWARLKVKGDGKSIPASVNIIVGQSQYNCPIWVERRAWVDWAENSKHSRKIQPSEMRKMVARDSPVDSLDSLYFPSLGRRKAKEKIKHKVWKPKRIQKTVERAQPLLVGDQSNGFKKSDTPNSLAVTEALPTINRFKVLSLLNEEDSMQDSLHFKDDINGDIGSSVRLLRKDISAGSSRDLKVYGRKHSFRKSSNKTQISLEPSNSSISPFDLFGNDINEDSMDVPNKPFSANLLPFSGSQDEYTENVLDCIPLASVGPDEGWQEEGNHFLLENCGQDQHMISTWVLNRMKSFKKILGISSEGFEDKIMELLLSIEERRSINTSGQRKQQKSASLIGVRELRNLHSSIRYDKEGKNSTQGERRRGESLSLYFK